MTINAKHEIMFREMTISSEAGKIFENIRDSLDHHGKPPSIREIAIKVNLSTRQVLHYLTELEAGGFIRRSPYKTRTIQLITRDETLPEKDVSMLPLIGTSAAGPVILAEQNIEEYVPVSTRLIGSNKDTFLLKVKGSSMQPYLENGDIAIVRPQNVAEKGDIVVVAIENDFTREFESTMKEYVPTDGQIILQPLNKDFDPILAKKENLHIQGIVKGVIKYF